jgi:oligopeptidase A
MFHTFDPTILDGAVEKLDMLLNQHREKIQALIAIEDKTYNNFVKPFILLDEELELFFTPISHLNSVDNSETSQQVYADCLPLLSLYSTEIGQNLDLFNAFKAIDQTTLITQERKVLEDILHDFELSGAALDNEKKERLKAINLRKSELSNDFSQNVLDATNAYELIIDNDADVMGIPQTDLDNAHFEEDGKTKYRFTLQMPSYIAYMTYGPNRELRETLYKAYTTRAPENSDVISEILRLKDEASKILGFNNYAERSLATKMAPNTQSVLDFLNNLATASRPQGEKELETLTLLAQEDDIDELQSFDVAYYSEQLKKRDYAIDEEAYRPYFEQHQVVSGLFNFLELLFHISFKKADTQLWNDHTSAYDIIENDHVIARIFLDLEARKSKRGGAWMHNWQSHHTDENGNENLASAFVVCNFPPKNENTPSLLRHDDVVTLFHEMGHAIHHLLSRVNENAVSGVNGVEWDAVEFPSQFLENFAYEREVLKLFAKHYETGEVLPDNMIDKLEHAKNFQSALGMLRQLEFALFDFELHLSLHQGDEVQTCLDDVRKRVSLLPPPSYNKFQHGFNHIFGGGYAAGYYSYKWAEVLSADAFFYFVDNGIFDKNIASRYREIVLGMGSSQSMGILFEEFMERPLDTQALLRLSGIHA